MVKVVMVKVVKLDFWKYFSRLKIVYINNIYYLYILSLELSSLIRFRVWPLWPWPLWPQFTLKIHTLRKFVLKFVIIPLLWIFYITFASTYTFFPTAPAVKTIELFANRNISKRESNNNYTKPKFTAETRSKVTLHIYHLSVVQKQKNNHIQNSSLSLKSVHKKVSKSL